MSDEIKDDRKKYVSYLDEKNEIQEGYFWVIETKDGLISISTGTNIIQFPISRLLKIKGRVEK